MAEIKQMIITRRVHIKIISPHAVNISPVSLSTLSDAGIMIQSYQNKQTQSSFPIRSILTPLRSDTGWCNGLCARVLTLPLTSLLTVIIRVWPGFLPRQRSLGSTPSITVRPLWTNSNKNSNTGYGEQARKPFSINQQAEAAISLVQVLNRDQFSW